MTTVANPADLPLRDIHFPQGVGWWPPAAGWWLLVALLAVSVVLLCWYWRYRARHRIARLTLAAIDRLDADFTATADSDGVIEALSDLLRRASMTQFGRPDSAALTGEAWLRFLDQNLDDAPFSKGAGRCLAVAPYQNPVLREAVDIRVLLTIARRGVRAWRLEKE